MDEFLIRALAGGLGIAVLCGPLGSLMIWQRMVYFGAALSHGALLGVVLGLYLNLSLYLSILVVCITLSFLLLYMDRFKNLTSDTTLGILAHTALALGIVVLSLIPSVRIDLMAYLFGDILSVSWWDVFWIYGGGIMVIGLLGMIWRSLLSLIIQTDLALIDGVKERKIRLTFLVLLSFVVAVSMQVVGVLLIVSMLIIPAACARKFSNSPEQMACLASLFGCLAVILGLGVSLLLDSPAGPSIVVAAAILFALSLLVGKVRVSY